MEDRPMRAAERRDRIFGLIAEHQRMTVEVLAQRLGASQETIRRDLTELDARHLVRKVHGGAVLPGSLGEGAFQRRMVENLAGKRAIAAAAIRLFQPGDALCIDTGSTTLAFAAELAQRGDLTVITNAVGIAQQASRGGHQTFLLGGEHRAEAGENVGPLVLQQLAGFSPDHAVLTVGGITTDGIHDFDLQEAAIARAMIERCREVTILADASKFGRPALFPLCALAGLRRIVTDALPPATLAQALEAAGVEVIVAAPTINSVKIG
jgi:DeoR/GlpR family transcriptional regulator of sugar metabolism